jgi:DoxX-like family
METIATAGVSKGALWTGRVISTLCILFLLFDGITKVIQERHTVAAMAQGGYRVGLLVPFGITVLACTILYAIPATAVLGALLLTAWLGGATDSMVRMDSPGHPFLFPVVFGVLVWLGLYLREPRLHQILPVRKGR